MPFTSTLHRPQRVHNQGLIGLIDNINNTYNTLSPFDPSSVELKLNGIILTNIDDFNMLNSTTIEFNTSPVIGDKLLISYNRM